MAKGWMQAQAHSTQSEMSNWTPAIKKSANVEYVKFASSEKSVKKQTSGQKKAS